MDRYTITVTARYQVTAATDAAALGRLADRLAEPKDGAVTMLAWDAECAETSLVLSCARTKVAHGAPGQRGGRHD